LLILKLQGQHPRQGNWLDDWGCLEHDGFIAVHEHAIFEMVSKPTGQYGFFDVFA
jgi:hypothetical protein